MVKNRAKKMWYRQIGEKRMFWDGIKDEYHGPKHCSFKFYLDRLGG